MSKRTAQSSLATSTQDSTGRPLRRSRPTPHQIRRHRPRSINEVIGNRELKDFVATALTSPVRGQSVSLKLAGPRLSGKTATIQLYLQTLMCPHRDLVSFAPCYGKDCLACRNYKPWYSHVGLSHLMTGTYEDDTVQVIALPCGKIDQNDITRELSSLKEVDGVRIIVLEDAGLLRPRGLERVLKAESERLDTVWIALDEDFRELHDSPLLEKFDRTIRTQLPEPSEFIPYLIDHCEEWEIDFDRDDPELFVILGERSGYVVGRALKVIAQAAQDGRHLPRLLVETFDFSPAQVLASI
jgi:hypothetical protein